MLYDPVPSLEAAASATKQDRVRLAPEWFAFGSQSNATLICLKAGIGQGCRSILAADSQCLDNHAYDPMQSLEAAASAVKQDRIKLASAKAAALLAVDPECLDNRAGRASRLLEVVTGEQ